MTASVLKPDPTTQKAQKNAIYLTKYLWFCPNNNQRSFEPLMCLDLEKLVFY